MRAAVIREYGGPDVLRPEVIPDVECPPGWVLVRLEASGLNWHDVLVRRGQYQTPLPHVLGADGAGVRTDTGEEVMVMPSLWWGSDEAAPGPDWEILGDRRSGTYAELVAVPEECVLRRPAGMEAAQAAALPLVGLTVFRAVFTRGRLQAGESLLILGASGGVATMAVSLATAAGAHVVVTSSSKRKIDLARGLGAASGVDHDATDWVRQARALTPGHRGFDVVLDPVGRWRESVECLRPGGRCVVLGANAATRAELEVRPFYFGQYELLGTTMGSPSDMTALLRFLDTHEVRLPPIDRTFPLDEAAAAHRRLESGAGIGKIVLLHH